MAGLPESGVWGLNGHVEGKKIYASPKGVFIYHPDYDCVRQLRVWEFLYIFRKQSVRVTTETRRARSFTEKKFTQGT